MTKKNQNKHKPEKQKNQQHPQSEHQPQEDRSRIEELQAERDDLLERLQRVSADYLNYQKRVKREIEDVKEFANENLMKSLLDILDDMERALDVARENHDKDDPVVAGMQIVHDKAMKTLERFGLERMSAAGKPLDPESQKALMQEESDEYPPGTVLREVYKGYKLKGRVIRPAGVIVTKAPQSEDAGEQPQQEQEQ